MQEVFRRVKLRWPQLSACRGRHGGVLASDEGPMGPLMASAERLGYISTEGGPLLIGDRQVALNWKGASGDGADYQRACKQLESNPGIAGAEIHIAGSVAIVWDMPTGTADVWRRTPSSLSLTRSWLDSDNDRGAVLAELPPDNPVRLGTFRLESGWLVVVWAVENGEDIDHVEPASARALDLSVGHAGILVDFPNGTYVCYHDEIADGADTARRCVIVPVLQNLSR
jgi:hypothetical protein